MSNRSTTTLHNEHGQAYMSIYKHWSGTPWAWGADLAERLAKLNQEGTADQWDTLFCIVTYMLSQGSGSESPEPISNGHPPDMGEFDYAVFPPVGRRGPALEVRNPVTLEVFYRAEFDQPSALQLYLTWAEDYRVSLLV